MAAIDTKQITKEWIEKTPITIDDLRESLFVVPVKIKGVCIWSIINNAILPRAKELYECMYDADKVYDVMCKTHISCRGAPQGLYPIVYSSAVQTLYNYIVFLDEDIPNIDLYRAQFLIVQAAVDKRMRDDIAETKASRGRNKK